MLELVNGQPPNLNQPIDLVCLHILAMAAPEIDEKVWSADMRDFLKICLIKDPVLRAGREELLSHPFIKAESSLEEIDSARQEFLALLLPFRKEKAFKAESEGEAVLVMERVAK